mgnify:CR=1 FL=1
MEWIRVDEEIFEYVAQCTRSADTALYGRITYEMMESYWPTAADQPVAVCEGLVKTYGDRRPTRR